MSRFSVLIFAAGGTVRTVPTDIVTAQQIATAAKISGGSAMIVNYGRNERMIWEDELAAERAVVGEMAVYAGTCAGCLHPTGESIHVLMPLGAQLIDGDGQPITIGKASFPQGTEADHG